MKKKYLVEIDIEGFKGSENFDLRSFLMTMTSTELDLAIDNEEIEDYNVEVIECEV